MSSLKDIIGSKAEDESQWISISDFMTALMVIFLFIAVIYMREVNGIISSYRDSRNAIYKNLKKEFGSDLKKWKAELIRESLTIRFVAPEIFFDPAKSTIKPAFKIILNNFCPRYFKTIYQSKKDIEEIRIEGHTSIEWFNFPKNIAYFKNMELSQNRTRSVLQYCFNLVKNSNQNKEWIRKHLTANGLSSSKPLKKCNQLACHRRVEFRVQVKAESVLNKISNFGMKKNRRFR